MYVYAPRHRVCVQQITCCSSGGTLMLVGEIRACARPRAHMLRGEGIVRICSSFNPHVWLLCHIQFRVNLQDAHWVTGSCLSCVKWDALCRGSEEEHGLFRRATRSLAIGMVGDTHLFRERLTQMDSDDLDKICRRWPLQLHCVSYCAQMCWT